MITLLSSRYPLGWGRSLGQPIQMWCPKPMWLIPSWNTQYVRIHNVNETLGLQTFLWCHTLKWFLWHTCIYMDKTGCKWICMFWIRFVILNVPSVLRKRLRNRISLLVWPLHKWQGAAWGHSNTFHPQHTHDREQGQHESNVQAPPQDWYVALPGGESKPEWIPCSATRVCMILGKLLTPHSIDAGAERLIPPASLLHQTLQSSKFYTSISLVIIQSWTQINEKAREMPEHSSCLSCTQRTEWTSASIPSSSPEIIHLWDRCMRRGREGDEFTLSPLNQRLSQLIYSTLERIRVPLVQNVLGTYQIYSNAINIIP